MKRLKYKEISERLFMILVANAYQAYSTALNCGTQDLERRSNFHHNPEIGDLVLEVTLGIMYPSINSIGYLRGIDRKKNSYTIERLYDGGETNWGNCRFVRIHENIFEP